MLILQVPEFPNNTVQDWSKEAPMPKPNANSLVVLIQYQLVTDEQMTTQHRVVKNRNMHFTVPPTD